MSLQAATVNRSTLHTVSTLLIKKVSEIGNMGDAFTFREGAQSHRYSQDLPKRGGNESTVEG